MNLLAQARSQVEPLVALPNSDVHTVYEGIDPKTGKPAVVALVGKKKPLDEITSQGFVPVPQSVSVPGNGDIKVDVQEHPVPAGEAPFRIQLLTLKDSVREAWQVQRGETVQSASAHQACFSPLVPGGVQIAPRGANWVGTCGVGWKWTDETGERIGFLTNRHVAGIERRAGDPICQPNGSSNVVGTLVKYNDFRLDQPNELDVAYYDSKIGGKHFISREIFGLSKYGKLLPGTVDFALNDAAAKAGRTTADTLGKCIGLNGKTTVNYGEGRNVQVAGVCMFRKNDGGDFSAPGDSGSAIVRVDAEGLRVGALLFAGGNGTTIAIPITTVQRAFGGEPFVA